MASLISIVEGERSVADDEFFGLPFDFLRLDPDQEAATLERMLNTAVDRVESRLAHRFVARPLTVIVRADKAGELIELPVTPVTITTAETFDAATGLFSASDPLVSGPTLSSFVLPTAAIWRLSGVAGPDPAVQPPDAIKSAIERLVAFYFENRGDAEHDFTAQGELIGSGAADLIRAFVRI